MLLILSTFLYLSSCICENPLLMTTGNSEQLAKTAECVLKLSAKYFVEKKALSGSIVIINVNSYSSSTQGLLLQTIHSGIKYSIMVKDSLYHHANASHFPEKAKNYMLILEEKSELKRNIMQLNRLPTWNPLAKAIVFYQLKNNETGEEVSIEFINVLRVHKLFKTIIFIYDESNEEVLSYAWKPYTEINCGGLCDSVYILDVCKDQIIHEITKQKEIFPSDMRGCPLVAYAVIAEPYVMPPVKKITDSFFDDAYDFDKGVEVKLVKIISYFTNMTLVFRMSAVSENWGTVYPNGTTTGAYNVLRNDSADLILGNIEVTRTIRKWFHPTISYTQDDMTLCVAKAREASTWNSLVIIFQWTTWVATFMSLLIMGIMFHYLYYKEKRGNITKWPTNSLLMTFSMLLGWGATFEPKSSAFRILMFAWLYFSVNMSISYESFLRSFLMHPRFEKQISTTTDLMQLGIPLGGREIYRAYFETNPASSFYLYRKYKTITFDDGIKRAALHRNFAVISSRRQAGYQDQKLGKGKPLLYCFSESNNMYKYGVALLARKWFPILERFNIIIRSVTENGLIDKWSNELLLHSGSAEVTGTVVPLSVQHLLGAFMFVGFMYGVSIIVFFVELAVGYTKRVRARQFKNIFNP